MRRSGLAMTMLATSLGGCLAADGTPQANGSRPPRAGLQRLVEVSAIVNALKCELAATFARRAERVAMVKAKVTGSLALTNVVAQETSGGASIGVTPLGLSFGPRIDHARATERSDAVKLDFHYLLDGAQPVPEFCRTESTRVHVEHSPFATLLDGLAAEYARIRSGAPRVQLEKLSYTAGFDVTRSEEGAVKLEFAVFGLSAGRKISRGREQSITLAFDIDEREMPPAVPM